MNDVDANEKGIDQSDVLEKYKAAGQIVDQVMEMVQKAAYSGMNVRTLCQLSDMLIEKKTANVYSKAKTENGEKVEKGIAFPTCVCINNCASHFCPIETDAENETNLSTSDIITVQLGVHIDGYSALGAQTLIVRSSKDSDEITPLEGRAADAVVAAYTAAEAVLRVMRPGKTNEDVSEIISNVAKDFDVEPLDGVLSHEMKRYVIDGSKVIMNRQSLESRADKWEFENYEVYNLDVVMSTGEGKAIERDTRETVYKRQVDVDYKLKMKTSRQVFSEINKSYPTMPFTLRALNDSKKSRMAMTEMLKHSLVIGYPVLYEKDGEIIARCSMTVLITPKATKTITKNEMPKVLCSKEIMNEKVKELLSISLEKKKKKNDKKKVDVMETELS